MKITHNQLRRLICEEVSEYDKAVRKVKAMTGKVIRSWKERNDRAARQHLDNVVLFIGESPSEWRQWLSYYFLWKLSKSQAGVDRGALFSHGGLPGPLGGLDTKMAEYVYPTHAEMAPKLNDANTTEEYVKAYDELTVLRKLRGPNSTPEHFRAALDG